MKAFFDKFQNLKGASFVGIKEYENKNGEISNLTVLVNFDMEKAKLSDLNSLKRLTVLELTTIAKEKKLDIETLIKAHNDLIVSAEKNLSEVKTERTTTSQAQTDAYIHLTKGIKMHKETMNVFVYGRVNTKNILEEGVKEVRNKRPLTICKDAIKKHLDLRMNKYRQYNVGNLNQLRINGTSFVRS